jgi:hypothetical protein
MSWVSGDAPLLEIMLINCHLSSEVTWSSIQVSCNIQVSRLPKRQAPALVRNARLSSPSTIDNGAAVAVNRLSTDTRAV